MRFHTARLSLMTHGLLSFLLVLGSTASAVFAQSSHIVVTPPGPGGLGTTIKTSGNITDITNGTRPGGGQNLFHSFNQFSVAAGDVANFVNPGGVSNIISRVIAGGFQSNIFGTIQANANLFFINPNGIVFGPSAQLNVSGSAYFSTADQLRLNDNQVFTANPAFLALDGKLSAAPPVAFGFLGQVPNGPIVLSSGTLLQANGANGAVGLIGGAIQINGSKITAHRITVASATSGEISAQPDAPAPFSGASGGQIQMLPGTLLLAGGGSGVPPAVQVFPGTITVPEGAQVNRTTNSSTQLVTQIEVVGPPGSSFLPLSFPASTVTTPNFIDPVAFLNRAALLLPQEAPAAPAALLTSRCASRKDGEFSSLVQAPRDVTPSQPGVAMATPVVLQEVGGDMGPGVPTAQTAQGQGVSTAHGIESWQGC